LISDVVPNDEARQVNEAYYIERVVGPLAPRSIVLDLGCGEGKAQRSVTRANSGVMWMGVDLPSSPEVDLRSSARERLVSFDGVELPFRSSSIDCILSVQVLEHVRHPEPLLREVTRVLKPGAPFAGTTSNLEPYHSFSLWNFTPYGFVTIARDAGLEVVELRPGIDGPTLIERQIRGRPPEMSKYFSSTSPRNSEFLDWGRGKRRRPALVNNRMLQFSGHFGFLTRRPLD
jgi:SAM-dependent methyltransferase